jgi:peroxiredoxin
MEYQITRNFWKGLLLVVFTTVPLLGCPSGQDSTMPVSGSINFSLRTLEGEEIVLKEYQGKKVVHLIFWATWCPSCLIEMPKLKKLYDAIGKKPYEILAINVGLNDSLKRVEQLKQQYQIPYKILFDAKGEVSMRYGIVGIPTHIIIDKDGTIKNRFNQLPEDPQGYLKQLFPS